MSGNVEKSFSVNLGGEQFLLQVGQTISDISNSNLKQIVSLFDDGNDKIDEKEFTKLKQYEKGINSIMEQVQSQERLEFNVSNTTGVPQMESFWSLNIFQNLVNIRKNPEDQNVFYAYEYNSLGNLLSLKSQDHKFETTYKYDEKGNLIKSTVKDSFDNWNNERKYDETGAPVYDKTTYNREDGSVGGRVEKYVNDKNGNTILTMIDEDNNGTTDDVIPYWRKAFMR